MTRLRFAIAAVALSLATASIAKDAWQTVTLRGEPGLTISIPAAAVNTPDAKDPDDLMFFAVSTKLHGALTCLAQRNGYPQGMTRADFAAALATERREAFCGQSRSTVSGISILGSQSFEHGGSQAAVCTASFTDSARELPGQVSSQMIVAAPDKAYFLTCTVEDEEVGLAGYSWSAFWGEKVRHIQASFRLAP
jgi:hypothetical protein